MRIVIDLQGDQSTGSRNRGIGRYSLSIAQAIARNRGDHEVIIALNGSFPETIDPLASAFAGILPQKNIRVWDSITNVSHGEDQNIHRRMAAERIRECFLASLEPDVIYVTSLFEGLGDDTVTSLGRLNVETPIVTTLFDLIPYLHPVPYLEDPRIAKWYHEKIEFLKRSSMLLAISDSARSDVIIHLGVAPNCVVNIAAAAEPHFRPLELEEKSGGEVLLRHGLTRPFVMYTGGIDHRKNIEGLISAYSLLPDSLRNQHQLAVVCSISPESRDMLEALASSLGLSSDELILTGYVTEEDLVVLYNLSKLFIFPSKYEGFGLPALEAMACGTATIVSNTSSLPEIIGRADAMFNPNSNEEIAAKLREVLENDDFRAELARSGLLRSQRFSWDASAKIAISAMERVHDQPKDRPSTEAGNERLKLAYVSPLPPERSGIADYSAELIVALQRHYELTVITPQKEISDVMIRTNIRIQTPDWLLEHKDEFDRVLYHFGNSTFHSHMFSMLDELAGVVVLHDFYLGNIIAHMELHENVAGAWTTAIFKSHGYPALIEKQNDNSKAIWKYPVNLGVLQHARGVIVHSKNSKNLARSWYGNDTDSNWFVIPHLRVAAEGGAKPDAKSALGFTEDTFLVCSFGLMGEAKLNERLLVAWLDSALAQDESVFLVFVGENDHDSYGMEISRKIRESGLAERILITGWASTECYKSYLSAADMAVQLRGKSRGETSGTILDCMNYGLPVIANANGSAAEIIAEAAWIIPDEFEDSELIQALETLHLDRSKRIELGRTAAEIIRTVHDPETCARMYADAIEQSYQKRPVVTQDLVAHIADIESINISDVDVAEIARSISRNEPSPLGQKSLFIDVSELCQRDFKTGIQRVLNQLLRELFDIVPVSYRIEPVYATLDKEGYHYARDFSMRFMGGAPVDYLYDAPIDFKSGDVFLVLDHAVEVILAQEQSLKILKQRGVAVHFVVYDIIPALYPHYFGPNAETIFCKWLKCALEHSDRIHCISQATASDLRVWASKCHLELPQIRTFHLGADFLPKIESRGAEDGKIIEAISTRQLFLSVSTIEPRKKQTQILDAFELLWNKGVDVNLVLVGKEGWHVEELVRRLRNHGENGNRLFWLEGISDELLNDIYQASSALIFASVAEGFGLAVIEAAQHGLPIILRDIPVFREIAGDHAFYFKGEAADDLANAVTQWQELNAADQALQSASIPWLTWNQSARQLIAAMDIGEFKESTRG